jgi:hypothetical protein
MANAKALRFGKPAKAPEPVVQKSPVSTEREQPVASEQPAADPRGEPYTVGGITVWRRKRKN